MIASRWIALLAYDGRVRHAATRRRQHVEAARLASMHSRVIADLRSAIASDLEGFVASPDRSAASLVTCRNGASAEGFVVRLDEPEGARSLTVDLGDGTLQCRYEITSHAADASVAERSVTIEIGDGLAVSTWTEGVSRVFETAEVLGAFLLAPILGSTCRVPPFVTASRLSHS